MITARISREVSGSEAPGQNSLRRMMKRFALVAAAVMRAR
jgi:hypothetical protein